METATTIHNFHVGTLRENPDWTIRDTALSLNWSVGAISQYLTIASWMRTHERELRMCDTMKEAVAFIKRKKYELKTDA